MARTRDIIIPSTNFGSGKRTGTGLTIFQNPGDIAVMNRHTCSDSLGRRTDHPCEIKHKDVSEIEPLHGFVIWGPTDTRSFSQYYAPLTVNDNTHLSTSTPNQTALATMALARTNPNRADVSLWNFVYELKDLPGMVRDIGRLLANPKAIVHYREIGNAWLAGNFGWAPLISDIRKMMDFQQRVDKRVNELERLYSSRGLKRRVELGTYSAHEQSGNLTIHSAIIGLTARRSRLTVDRAWATVRWKPVSVPRTIPNSKGLQKLAKSLVYGHNLQAEYVWNAIPWSWLIDWFGNVGTYLRANANTVPVTNSTPNVMVHRVTKTYWVRTDPYYPRIRGGTGSSIYESKIRYLNGGGITVSFPFLTGKQLSILAALKLQRIR